MKFQKTRVFPVGCWPASKQSESLDFLKGRSAEAGAAAAQEEEEEEDVVVENLVSEAWEAGHGEG